MKLELTNMPNVFTFNCRHSSYIEFYKKSMSFNMHPNSVQCNVEEQHLT